MLPGSGCWVGRVTSHRDGAGLCCASPPACPALREDVGRSRCVFEAVFGVNVSLCSRSHQQFTPCPHTAQHLPWELANPLASPQKCSGVPFPRGIPQSCVLRRDPHPLQEHQGRASGRRGSGSTGTLAGGKNRLRKRRQINQADSFRSDAASKKGEPLWGARGRASRPPAPGPRRRL